MPTTIEEFAKAILGESIYNELMTEINSSSVISAEGKTKQSKFFYTGNKNGLQFPVLNVDKDNNLYKVDSDGKK
jgi:hypothetical protein